MRIAQLGDFDSYVCRGLERPRELLPIRQPTGLNLVRGFKEVGGHDVHIVVTTKEVTRPTVDEGPFGIVHRLPQPRFSGSACFQLWRRAMILRELAKINPDVVHGQGTEAEYALTAVTAPYPHVITFHGIMHRVHEVVPPPFFSIQHVSRWTEKFVAAKARHVISISQDVDDFLDRRHSPARRYRIPNAMAPCFFQVPPTPRPPDRLRLLFVGSIGPRKGLLYAVEALAALRPRLTVPVTLEVIGAGERGYGERVRQRVHELGLESAVLWQGTRSEQEVADALAQTDVLVLPSFWENMPMCIGEALAAGVPVVSTRVAGIPQWVREGVDGLLVEPGNVAALTDALFQLLTDADLRQRMGRAGRAKALAQYAPAVVARQTLDVYATILRDR